MVKWERHPILVNLNPEKPNPSSSPAWKHYPIFFCFLKSFFFWKRANFLKSSTFENSNNNYRTKEISSYSIYKPRNHSLLLYIKNLESTQYFLKTRPFFFQKHSISLTKYKLYKNFTYQICKQYISQKYIN